MRLVYTLLALVLAAGLIAALSDTDALLFVGGVIVGVAIVFSVVLAAIKGRHS